MEKQIEEITRDKETAEYNYQQRLKHIKIFPSGKYSVRTSDATVHVNHYNNSYYSPSEPEKPKEKGTHEEIQYKIINTTVSAGFDQNGNPVTRKGMDVVPVKVLVDDN